MGIPLVIINHATEQYITAASSAVYERELAVILPLYAKLIASGEWKHEDVEIRFLSCDRFDERYAHGYPYYPEDYSDYECILDTQDDKYDGPKLPVNND